MGLNNFRTEHLIWDRVNSHVTYSLETNSGDSNGRKLRVQVLDGGVVTALSGVTLSLAWKTANQINSGLDAFKLVDVALGIFEIYYTTEMLSNVGKLKASLVLVDATGRMESDTFPITVNPTMVDDNAVQGENSFTALTEALVKVNEWNGRIDDVEQDYADRAENLEETYAPRLTEVTAQLAQTNALKVGNGVQAEMSDLSQSVRENLTNGNVAVVGKGSINNVNVNSKQITPDKTTDIVTINITDLPIFSSGHYYDTLGILKESASFNVRKYRIPIESKGIALNYHTVNSTPNGIIKYDDDTFQLIAQQPFLNVHKGVLLFNESMGQNIGVKSITSKFWKKGFVEPTIYNAINGEHYNDDFVVRNGLSEKISGYSNYKLIIKNDYIYTALQSAQANYFGSWFTKDDVFISNVTKNSLNELIVPSNAAYGLLNLTVDDSVTMKLKELAVTNVVTKMKTSLNKPYVFNGKTADWAGDSILKGHMTGSTITPNNLAKLFSEKVNFTSYSNVANAGALFSKGYNEVETILETIKRVGIVKDYLFIVAGTNDYGLGVPLTVFKQSIIELCAYLKANYTGQVIFIAPLNRIRPSDNQQAPLESYRTIIGQEALKNDYSFINGGEFNFPSESSEFSDLVYGDGLHLTELGNRIYSKSLSTLIC